MLATAQTGIARRRRPVPTLASRVQEPADMEMEFKDSSRRRTLVLVVGVLLAIAAGAAAFMLSSQGQTEPEAAFPTRDVVVAAEPIAARETIDGLKLAIRPVPIDDTNAQAFTDREQVVNQVAAIPILQFQPITPNMLASGAGVGQVQILKAEETIAPDSPYLRAVSMTVPADRAVGGKVAVGEHVDLIATLPIVVSAPVNPDTGEPLTTDPETGEPLAFVEGSSTKLMWLDVEILVRDEGTDVYIVRADLQTAEEIAHAQTQGAQFTMVLRPDEDTRDVDRSTYGETTDTLITRYNFRVPETIDGAEYGQPVAFPTPFPNEPYLSPAPEPSPSPESALIVAPTESPAP
jgi:Flp pilus assembly protein CpaB